MKKKYLYIISIIIPLLTSCEDWLNVNPKTEINSDILYQTENGFKSALAGIYTIMTETSLYGRETTFGLIGVLGMEWNVTTGQIASSTNEYYYAKNYDYENTLTKTKISNIWSKSYNAISNINKLIEYTETNREVLKDINYEVIRGEAFALRAYLHFDLLRMFASADFSSDIEYLPYSETSLPQVSILRTPAEIIEYVLTDLETAEELLINDPINATEEDVVDSYFRNRHFHMNYWAVKALKARVYLYSGNKEKALEESLAVIGSQETGLFQWVDPDDVSNTNANLRDRTFSSEHIFSLNNTKMKDQISGYFYDTTTPLLCRFSVSDFGLGCLFSEQADYRYFFDENNGIVDIPSKFWQMDNSNGITPKKNRMPMLRISEMYYIAAECTAETNLEKAIDYIRTVQINRGMTSVISPDTDNLMFYEELLNEYQREFIGEGQIFFYHKRKGTSVIYNATAEYIFPLPDSETDFRN